jgi:flagellar protein FliS
MFTSVSSRSAASYRLVGEESAVHGSSPHQLIGMLFTGALKAIAAAKIAIDRRDTTTKVREIGKAVRIVQEGLMGNLDTQQGGAVAANLAQIYEYCGIRLMQANLRSDVSALDEVTQLLTTVSAGWSEMNGVGNKSAAAFVN